MRENDDSEISELAQHIVYLAAFRRRSETAHLARAADRAIRAMLETGLGLDAAEAEELTVVVVARLGALDTRAGEYGAGSPAAQAEVVSSVIRERNSVDRRQLALF